MGAIAQEEEAPRGRSRQRAGRAWLARARHAVAEFRRSAAGRARLAGDVGMATAEYAIATVAAVGFAGLLIAVLRSDEVRGLLAGIVRGALSV